MASEDADKNSVLNHFRNLTKTRKEHPVLIYGAYQLLQKEHPEIYAYTRKTEAEECLVLLNFSEKSVSINLKELDKATEVWSNNYDDFNVSGGKASLKPYQAVIVSLK